MKFKAFILFVLIVLPVVVNAQAKQRFIAVTIDDLPVVSTRKDLKNRQEITKKLLAHITEAKVPAIGFVNENKLYNGDQRDEAQVDLLRQWLNAGLELGNHTFSHLSLNNNPLEKFEAEILQGEIITKELLAAKNQRIRYFRHPFLHTGTSLEIKAELNKFLAEHGYTIAPVTCDNEDYIFSSAYDRAFDKKDKKMMRRVGAAYVPFLEAKMDFCERQSVKLFDREIKQTLLIHANFINSDYFDDIARMLKKRGYQFVTLENALTDDAYRLPDTFVSPGGVLWIYRWALASGENKVLPNEPQVPDFVVQASEFNSN